MVKQNVVMSNFSFGEISRNLFGRGNIEAYKNAAMNLTNMNVIPTGGIERRDGLRYVDTLQSSGKIIAFEYSSDKLFILFFGDGIIVGYDEDDNKVFELGSPYKIEHLKNIRWSQKGSELYLTHPEVEPQILKFNPLTEEWAISAWVYAKNIEYGYSCQPFNRFDDTDGISITPSDVSGNITLTASKNLFTENHVGILLEINGGEVLIKSITSSTVANANVIVKLDSKSVDNLWQEQAFSSLRGYPKSVAFHQNRLVIGGSKSLTNRLWFSKTAEFMNFDLGTALDDEAIEFDIFSDKVNEIISVFSGRHLQVFTSDSEWMITGNPLTPSNIFVSQQTKIGSIADRYIPPKLVEGSTIFVARNKKEIREFYYGDLSENYLSDDLIMLSTHLLNNPIEQDYNVKKRTLYVVQSDGSIALLLTNKSYNINAWTKYETDGKFISVAVLLDSVYVVVERDGSYFLEIFDDEVYCDCAKKIYSKDGIDEVQNLEFLEGKNVIVNADDYIYDLVVIDGKVKLPKRSNNVMVGLPFMHLFCPLPVFISWNYMPRAVRLLEVSLRVMDTPLLQIDTGNGLRSITFLNFDSGNKFDESLPYYSGDLKVRGKGFVKNYEVPLFKIQSYKPYKFKILNISMLIEIVR